ncbi:HAD family hydrolase [Curtobacterium sp. MCBD17_023]|uniref:HAD family hydrolase n=1 Tax=Curtobacterium sp. MCBD17_023 TaxID=2175657 RepID=UPI0021ABA824|nr:HAD family hydrolase [Curtobacterium sp. MCBD17_023]
MQSGQLPTSVRGVVFDVGETLVDESRIWSLRAERAGVTPFALMALLGALIERDRDHHEVWGLLGVERPPTVPIEGRDLYPDALDCLRACRAAGLVVGIAGNQPAGVEQRLRAVGCAPDFIASSTSWGIAKPSPAFFARVVESARLPADAVLYVGDRLDNDVLPARAAGMRTALIRRGPWGHVHARRPGAELTDMQLGSLAELTRALPDRRGSSPS